MKSCYVVMSTSQSPIYIVIPSPKAVFITRKEAEKYCDEHNNNPRTTTELYVRKVSFVGGGHAL